MYLKLMRMFLYITKLGLNVQYTENNKSMKKSMYYLIQMLTYKAIFKLFFTGYD
jgi:hypothetical protein